MHSRTARLGLLTLAAAPALAQAPATPDRRPWLSEARTQLSAVTVGDFVLFVGGRRQDAALGDIDVYDDASGLWSTATLQVPRSRMGATVVTTGTKTYALFAGGDMTFGAFSDDVEIYDASIGPPEDPAAWSLVPLPSGPRRLVAATTVGTKAIFAGGTIPPFPTATDLVDIYDASVGPPDDPDAWSTATLSRPRMFLSATSVGTQALFAGGVDGSVVLDDVDIYDDSTGTWSSTESLSVPRGGTAATAVGSRAYFGGGFESFSTMSDVVDVYDSTDGSWSTEQLSVARAYAGATAVGTNVVFAGGVLSGQVVDGTIDVFDTQSRTWFPPMELARGRHWPGVTAIGSRAFVAGGTIAWDAGGRPIPTSIVDVIEL